MADVKPPLADAIRKRLTDAHGSVSKACDKLGLPYERIKKALQRNRFSPDELSALWPGRASESLKGDYEFIYAEPHFRLTQDEIASRLVGAKRNDSSFNVLEKIEPAFHSLIKSAGMTDFSGFVEDLYQQKLDKATSMVLFCDAASIPIEWNKSDRHFKPIIERQARALRAGATILYIMESRRADEVLGQADQAPDGVDDNFEWFLRHLALNHFESEEPNGFIALLRVPHCSFCIPYQKPTLFTKDASSSGSPPAPNYRYALTTIGLPETIDGAGDSGLIVAPLQQNVADAMINYLQQLLYDLHSTKKTELAKSPLRWRCFPGHEKDGKDTLDSLLTKLRGILK